MNLAGGSVKIYALAGAALLILASLILATALVLTGHDLTDVRFSPIFGFAFTAIVALFGVAGLGGAVQNVHMAVNGRLDQLVKASASEAYQKGLMTGAAVTSEAPPKPDPGQP